MEARFVCRPEEMYQRYEPNIHQRKGVTCNIYIYIYIYIYICIRISYHHCAASVPWLRAASTSAYLTLSSASCYLVV